MESVCGGNLTVGSNPTLSAILLPPESAIPEGSMMRSRTAVLLSIILICAGASPARAATQALSEVFRRVDPAVVEIHTQETGLPTMPQGQPVSISGLGSSVLIQEAGGLIGDLTGEGDFLHGGQVIAATPKIFAQMVTALAPFRAELVRDITPHAVHPAP